MAQVFPEFPSASVQGTPVLITQTASPGNLIHVADASDMDRVWLFAVHGGTIAVNELTVEFGGTAAANQWPIGLAQNDPRVITPGFPLTGSLEVRAFAQQGSVVRVTALVVRVG